MSVDLTTTYLGLHLDHPVVASSSPLTGSVDSLSALEEFGAAAVVLPSLFEEDVVRETSFILSASGLGSLIHAESVPHKAIPLDFLDVAQRCVRLVTEAKAALRIPVVASVNGTTTSGWTRYAAELDAAGADALELNVYRVSADPNDTAQSVEESILAVVAAVRSEVAVPLAVKIGPYFSALPAFVRRLIDAGANGLVLFNRFYQPDIDLDTLEVRPSLDLSTSADLRLPLRWTALLSANAATDLAVSGGVHEPTDVVKSLLVGASAVMTTASLLRHGPGHVTVLRNGLASWMTDHEYESVSQLRGSMAVHNVPDPDSYERANYVRVIQQAARTFAVRSN